MLNDTSREIEEMQNGLWMKRSSQERAKFMFSMFANARRAVISSLSKDLTEKEFKEQLYYRTYGERLPEDFFKNEVD